MSVFDVEKIRRDFPLLGTSVHGHPLVYLDNAATSQMPRSVIEAVTEQYSGYNAGINRGAHYLGMLSTERMEAAREAVRSFIGAGSSREVIFTSGATDSINTVAASFGERFVSEGDEIIVTVMEHHSNFIPWRMLCERKKARLIVVPLGEGGDLDSDFMAAAFSGRTRLVALTHVSNVLGAVNPVERIITMAHEHDVPVLVDGAQAMRHFPVDVQAMDCDFYCFSGHKMLAPAGIGVLYGKEKWLEKMPPARFGGGMVESVSEREMVPAAPPYRFEAGTPNCAGAVALAAAISYVEKTGRETIAARESLLLDHLTGVLSRIDGIRILGSPERRAGVLSFVAEGIHHFDMAVMLDKLGIAVRSGLHCAQPLHESMGLAGSVRVSPSFYNTGKEIDYLGESVERIAGIIKGQKS
jgi:cysteine desulfurase/selenocysteine lyase